MAEEKKYVREEIEHNRLRVDYFEGSIIDIISNLKGLLNDGEAKGYSKISIEECVWADGFFVEGERLETDKEFERRLKRIESARKGAKKKKAERAEKERKLYDKLKEKYGGD